MMQKYIRNRRSHRIPEIQILKDLQSVFDLDEAKARQYKEAGLAKAKNHFSWKFGIYWKECSFM